MTSCDIYIFFENGRVLHQLQYNDPQISYFPVNLSLPFLLLLFLLGVPYYTARRRVLGRCRRFARSYYYTATGRQQQQYSSTAIIIRQFQLCCSATACSATACCCCTRTYSCTGFCDDAVALRQQYRTRTVIRNRKAD